ncbi:hypothetical protein RUM44_012001 [Polyplax serrata]|uniref:Acylphosphatase-like domain-containing protein n=1 Tax=Polyplax serrata TaxID=468196 RepID=A0ABR1BC91_POLSC
MEVVQYRSVNLPMVSVEFNICGRFQGLYFMKHCKEECYKLGLCGWIKTGVRGNIFGKIQGFRSRVDQMMTWLSTKGSPGSQITDCYFHNYEFIRSREFNGFTLRF